jgi:hypothetical protein
MMGKVAKVGSALKRCLPVWVAAIGLAPAVVYAQIAKPPSAAKAPAPWKFRLEEARIGDIPVRSSRGKSPARRWCKPTSTESAPMTACASRP